MGKKRKRNVDLLIESENYFSFERPIRVCVEGPVKKLRKLKEQNGKKPIRKF